ncbi:hypothetical protein BC833DRAFT_662095 [Globomyces pollinis-pini]|nr:hypothetical protein BC833DRAFT_662095 [Globomyces pollinis-pini]
MKWTLTGPMDYASSFLRQVASLQKLTNSITPGFDSNGRTIQRPVKNAAEFEIRCKLTRKRPNQNVIPNTLPIGVFNCEGERESFEQYEDTLQAGTSVVVTARMQASYF